MTIKLSQEDAKAILEKYFKDNGLETMVYVERDTFPESKASLLTDVMREEDWHKIISNSPIECKIAMIKLIRSAVKISLCDAKSFVEKHGM